MQTVEEMTTSLRGMVARVLRPLARFLIRRGHPLSWIVEEMKQAYVVEAIREIERDGKVTTSRISLMTGIHRHEVKRIRETETPKFAKANHPVSTMIAQWKGDLIDDLGAPLPLGRVNRIEPATKSFFEVADRATNRDIAPATFLTECIHKGLVRHDEATDMVHLLQEALEPSRDLEEQMFFFARNEGDHLEAGFSNMIESPPPFFDRSVMYKGLSEKDALELDQLARKLAMEAILEVNREAKKRASNGSRGSFRFNFGSFIFFKRSDEE